MPTLEEIAAPFRTPPEYTERMEEFKKTGFGKALDKFEDIISIPGVDVLSPASGAMTGIGRGRAIRKVLQTSGIKSPSLRQEVATLIKRIPKKMLKEIYNVSRKKPLLDRLRKRGQFNSSLPPTARGVTLRGMTAKKTGKPVRFIGLSENQRLATFPHEVGHVLDRGSTPIKRVFYDPAKKVFTDAPYKTTPLRRVMQRISDKADDFFKRVNYSEGGARAIEALEDTSDVYMRSSQEITAELFASVVDKNPEKLRILRNMGFGPEINSLGRLMRKVK